MTTTGGDTLSLWRVSFIGYNHSIETNGAVAFSVQWLTESKGDGVRDTAVLVWEDGQYTLVARSGDTLPGIGVVREILAPASVVGNSQSRPSGGIHINSRGWMTCTRLTIRGRSLSSAPSSQLNQSARMKRPAIVGLRQASA